MRAGRKPFVGLALLILAASTWVHLAGPAGSQESGPGTWQPADRMEEPPTDCRNLNPEDLAPKECLGHASHIAVALDRSDCSSNSPPADGYPCGKVLVAGGATLPPDSALEVDPSQWARLAKMYDPGTNAWTPEESMNESRGATGKPPAAVLLDGPECRVNPNKAHCGDVLVIGGNNVATGGPAGVPATSELYDPVAKTWVNKRNLPDNFADPQAVLLDGEGCADKCGSVLAIGTGTAVAALYDPENLEWTEAPPPIVPRVPPGPPIAVLLTGPNCDDKCGNVLIAGGSAGSQLSEAELYDPARGVWVPTGQMREARFRHSAVALTGFQCESQQPPEWCGDVLVAGGTVEDNVPYDSAERYSPKSGAWVSAPVDPNANKMSAQRDSPTMTSLGDGRVLVTGGTHNKDPDRQEAAQTSADLYDPTTDRWTAIPVKSGSYRVGHSATRLPPGPFSGCQVKCGAVLVAGGQGIPVEDDRHDEPFYSDIVTADLFFPRPAISEVVPPVCGGTEVSIKGAGLASASQVRFDGVPAASFRVHPQRPDAEILAVSPHAATGNQSVTVTATGGTSASKSFAFPSPPAITSLSPDRGPVVGGTPVTITGSNLGGVTEVKFGSQPAVGVQPRSDTEILAVSPSHLRAETVDVSVRVAGCTSNRPFTYFTLPLVPDGSDDGPAGGAGDIQNPSSTTSGGPGAVSAPQAPQQSIGGTAPPGTAAGPPPSGTAPATLVAPGPAPVPGQLAAQTSAPTLVSGPSTTASIQQAAPGTGLANAASAPREEPAPRYGMVRVDSLAPGAASLLALAGVMLIGCFAVRGREAQALPGPQGAY